MIDIFALELWADYKDSNIHNSVFIITCTIIREKKVFSGVAVLGSVFVNGQMNRHIIDLYWFQKGATEVDFAKLDWLYNDGGPPHVT